MKKNKIYENFLALLLMGLFVFTSFMVVLLGANAYSKMVNKNTYEQRNRVAFDYIHNRIKEANSINDIEINDNKLIIKNDDYDIVIYHDGYIKEMLVKNIDEIDLLDGEKIVEVKDLKFNKDDNLIVVEIGDRKMEVIKR